MIEIPETLYQQHEQIEGASQEASSSKRIVSRNPLSQPQSETWDSTAHVRTVNPTKRSDKVSFLPEKNLKRRRRLERYLGDFELGRVGRKTGDVVGGETKQGIVIEPMS